MEEIVSELSMNSVYMTDVKFARKH